MSYGEQLLSQYLEVMVPHEFLRNHRPDWLRGLELDFYFPARQVGIEFQGDHHYQKTDYCENYDLVQRHDRLKRRLCKQAGIRLIVLDAIDLEWTRLRSKLKGLKGWHKKELKRRGRHVLSELNQKAIEYRRTLRDNHDSITARRRTSAKRKELVALAVSALLPAHAEQEKWCAWCGKWGNHTSGGCVALKTHLQETADKNKLTFIA